MSVKAKPGVKWVFAPGMFRIIEVLKLVSRDLGKDLTITSGSDGVHSGPADPHYSGNALDIRTNDLTSEQKTAVLKLLLLDLGPKFSGFLENPGKPTEHIHCQRLFGRDYTIEDFMKD